MPLMSDSLAVRMAKTSFPAPSSGSTSLARVSQVLDTFASRDSNGDVLTAVRHYPAREAQWAEFPEWIHPELRAAYHANGFRQDAVLQPAHTERDLGRLGHAGAVSLPNQGAGAGPVGGIV